MRKGAIYAVVTVSLIVVSGISVWAAWAMEIAIEGTGE